MADEEIEFGQVETARQQRRLRPDRNHQYAVVPCGVPAAEDLPIFVDLDALRDMEAHAISDARVELGGVLLGGQYEDDQSLPYVVIADTLRAQHYESTPGSFKFTHETWAEFTRQRAELPADLQIVGWYHTHPNWGVFLSELDRFICEHFFGRPVDVALVIDPCQGDRGFFQWAGPAPDRTRRTGGFYVFASRHRAVELSCFANYLENRLMPSNHPRTEGFPFSGVPSPVPSPPYADPRTAWHGTAVLGILLIQFLLLALLVWKTLEPDSPADGTDRPRDASVSAVAASEPADAGGGASREVELQLRLLGRIVDQLGQGTPQGLVPLLEQLQKENENFKADARVYRAQEEKVRAENESLSRTLAAAEQEKGELTKQVADLRATIRETELAQAQQERVAAPASSGATSATVDWVRQPKALVLGAVAMLVLCGVGYWALLAVRKRSQTPQFDRGIEPEPGAAATNGDDGPEGSSFT
jgi:proteasome lid subunit RPN8/RPN11